MDWFSIAQNDWSVYQDISRIAKYVQYNKITAEQYQQITGAVYA